MDWRDLCARLVPRALVLELAGARCLFCGAVTGGPGLCGPCSREFTPRTGGYCPGCGELAGEPWGAPTRCGRCRVEPRPWDAMGFFGEYGGALREAVLGFKFGGRLRGAALLGDLALHA